MEVCPALSQDSSALFKVVGAGQLDVMFIFILFYA